MLPYLAPPAAETTDSYSFNPKLPAGVKPVGPVEIDWDHPLAEGLTMLTVPQASGNAVDLVGKKEYTRDSNQFIAADRGGVGSDTTAVRQYQNTSANDAPLNIGTGNLTMFAVFNGKATGASEVFHQRSDKIGSPSLFLRVGSYYTDGGSSGLTEDGCLYAGSYELTSSARGIKVSSVSSDKPLVVVATRVGALWTLFVDGVRYSNSSGATNNITSGSPQYNSIGGGSWTTRPHTEPIYMVGTHDRALTDSQAKALSRDPYQFLKPVGPPIRITTPKPTALTYEYTIPDARWEAPAIMVPGVKPTGPVVIDWDHPLAKGLKVLAYSGEDVVAKSPAVATGAGAAIVRNEFELSGDDYNVAPANKFIGKEPTIGVIYTPSNVTNDNILVGDMYYDIASLNGGFGIRVNGAQVQLNSGSNSWSYSYKDSVLTANVKTTLVGTFETAGSDRRIYVDGVAQTPTGSLGSTTPGASNATYVGLCGNNGLYLFSTKAELEGSVEIAAIWDRALTEEEVLLWSRNPYCFLLPA